VSVLPLPTHHRRHSRLHLQAVNFVCSDKILPPTSSALSKPELWTSVRASGMDRWNKQCSSDPFQTRVLKSNVDTLAPFLTELFNRSLSAGAVTTAFKAAYVTPLLKKSDLDPANVQSYQPIANLSVLSKLLERLVAQQLLGHLNASKLLLICSQHTELTIPRRRRSLKSWRRR